MYVGRGQAQVLRQVGSCERPAPALPGPNAKLRAVLHDLFAVGRLEQPPLAGHGVDEEVLRVDSLADLLDGVDPLIQAHTLDGRRQAFSRSTAFAPEEVARINLLWSSGLDQRWCSALDLRRRSSRWRHGRRCSIGRRSSTLDRRRCLLWRRREGVRCLRRRIARGRSALNLRRCFRGRRPEWVRCLRRGIGRRRSALDLRRCFSWRRPEWVRCLRRGIGRRRRRPVDIRAVVDVLGDRLARPRHGIRPDSRRVARFADWKGHSVARCGAIG